MRKKSLLHMFGRIQAATLVVMCMFIFLESIIIFRKSSESLMSERTMLLSGECQDVSGSMKTMSRQTFEMLRSIMNDYDSIWSEDRGERLFDLQSVSSTIQEKMILYPDMEFVYVYRPGYFMVSRKQADVNGTEKIHLSEFLEHSAEAIGSYPATGRWILCNVQNIDYCGIIYHYLDMDLYVGTFIHADHLFKGLDLLFQEFQGTGMVSGPDGSFFELGSENGANNSETAALPEKALEGGLVLSGHYPVRVLEVFRNNVLSLIVGLLLMSIVSLFYQLLMMNKHILRPIYSLSDAAEEAENDLEHVRIPQNAEIIEIATLENTLNYLMHEVVAGRMELYEQKIQEQNMQLRELRAQLSPHFYLNAIMTASSMTYQNRTEETREYLSQLSKYMRYMMRITDNMVSVGEELSHVENYVKMQEIKFPDSIVLIIDCPPTLKEKKMPHLLLHTIVENVFKHAMNLTETLMLMISCQTVEQDGFRGFQIVVEDSGKGFTDEQLKKYNECNTETEETDQHIGLSNIKKSLRLRFGRDDLFMISDVIPHGARVEIRIPEEGGKK